MNLNTSDPDLSPMLTNNFIAFDSSQHTSCYVNNQLVLIVARLDSALQQITHYPVDKYYQNLTSYPLDSYIHLYNNFGLVITG